MADNYQPGHGLPVYFQPAGAGSAQRWDVEGWNGETEVATQVVTRTSHNGKTARRALTVDGRGTVTLSFDLDQPYYGSPWFITEGTLGVILQMVSINLNKFKLIPVVIKKVRDESSVSGVLKVTVDWEFNILAGSYSYPSV